jgi:hypothetical protein
MMAAARNLAQFIESSGSTWQKDPSRDQQIIENLLRTLIAAHNAERDWGPTA